MIIAICICNGNSENSNYVNFIEILQKSVYNCGNDDGNGIDGRYAYIVSV